jgi:hypothetical protein
MDVAELRASFNGTEALSARVREFRRDRMNVVQANEGPIALNEGPKLIFHIIPISAFVGALTLSPNESLLFSPLGVGGGFNLLHTLEGFATYSGAEDGDISRTYTLIFRNGIVEAAAHVGYESDKGLLIYPDSVERAILEEAGGYFRNLRRFGVEPPFYVAITLLGVRGYSLVSGDNFFFKKKRPLNRDSLIFPEILTEEASPDSQALFKPLFDLLWQAFGYPKSFNFNAEGRYVGRR